MQYSEFLFQLFYNLKALYQKNLRVPNLSFQQILAIAMVDDDGLEMSSLSKTLGIDNSTATRLIDGLQKKGMVKRVRDKFDNRILRIVLTDGGKSIHYLIQSQLKRIGCDIETQINSKAKEAIIESGISLNWALLKYLNK